jgi:leucyl aminopeptidase (aminopeptidase T)
MCTIKFVCEAKLILEKLMKEAAHSIVTRCACLKKGMNTLIICGKHNSAFAEHLMQECYTKHAYPHLWVFNEKLLPKKTKSAARDTEAILPKHTRSLLENSDMVFWLSQFENPKTAWTVLGEAACSYWDQVDESLKAKPLLLLNLLSAKCLKPMKIAYRTFLATFANAVNVNYYTLRETGLNIAAGLNARKMIHITDPNGTDLSFSIENRRVGLEVGTLEDCFSTGNECEVEIPAGEVYIAPLEDSANGTLVTDEVRDFNIRKLRMNFEKGKIIDFKAEKGRASFQNLLRKAQGNKDRIAEFGVGTNHGMKPLGIRIYDEKALGTAHIAIGNNTHLGGINKASIHIDFILYQPTIKADNTLLMKEGHVTKQVQTKTYRKYIA